MAKILLIDDSITILKLMQITLEYSGHEVFSASNGIDGLAMLARCSPDLVILDLNMPEMNGIEILKKLRSRPSAGSIPVLICTADSGKNSMAAAKAAGATGWIRKPVQPSQLGPMIDKLLVH